MRHLVLTRSAYAPDYPLAANRRRLELLRRVTVPSMAGQTDRHWAWLVLVDPLDPLLDERLATFDLAGAPVVVLRAGQEPWAPAASIPDGRMAGDLSGPWQRAVAANMGTAQRILTTRLDDDDALSVDALARVRRAAVAGRPGLQTWMLPSGYRYHHRRVQPMLHRANMFATLESARSPLHVVMEVKHNDLPLLAPVRSIDNAPAWLWVRHDDARSGSRSARLPIGNGIRRNFRIDWPFLEGLA
jgi:Putative rhamnosyl transferase